ncbi:hypothetical protein DFS34DRAFT_403632 [Phlyctochytrium arcticum]|nr:hypothetical protein DFS34DRAFT_403632 [Phlyctochytrium arcticum]
MILSCISICVLVSNVSRSSYFPFVLSIGPSSLETCNVIIQGCRLPSPCVDGRAVANIVDLLSDARPKLLYVPRPPSSCR